MDTNPDMLRCSLSHDVSSALCIRRGPRQRTLVSKMPDLLERHRMSQLSKDTGHIVDVTIVTEKSGGRNDPSPVKRSSE